MPPRRWASEQQRRAFFAKLNEGMAARGSRAWKWAKKDWSREHDDSILKTAATIAGSLAVGLAARKGAARYLKRTSIFGGMRGGTWFGRTNVGKGMLPTLRMAERFMRVPKRNLIATRRAARLQRRIARVAGVGVRDLRGLTDFSYRPFGSMLPGVLARTERLRGFSTPEVLDIVRKQVSTTAGKSFKEGSTIIAMNRTKIGLGGRLSTMLGSGRGLSGSREVLRHEVGHHVYAQLPVKTRVKLLRDLLATNKSFTDDYALMGRGMHAPTESFAETYRKWRNVPLRSVSRLRRTRAMRRERHALAVALNELRKIRS